MSFDFTLKTGHKTPLFLGIPSWQLFLAWPRPKWIEKMKKYKNEKKIRKHKDSSLILQWNCKKCQSAEMCFTGGVSTKFYFPKGKPENKKKRRKHKDSSLFYALSAKIRKKMKCNICRLRFSVDFGPPQKKNEEIIRTVQPFQAQIANFITKNYA